MAHFIERRAERRQRVLISGETFSVKGYSGAKCAILDRSPSGLRLRFSLGQAPAFDFLIAEGDQRTLWKCSVVWLREGNFGVRREKAD